VQVAVLDIHRHIGAQHAIGGLRAAVEVEVRTMPRRIRIDSAILRAVGAGVSRLPAARGVPAIVGSDITAALETDICARNVVEALTVEAADFHVLNRLGLDGKIGSLRPRNRDKPCRGAEEKNFSREGSISAGCALMEASPFTSSSARSPLLGRHAAITSAR